MLVAHFRPLQTLIFVAHADALRESYARWLPSYTI
jgi:hypothetical protein